MNATNNTSIILPAERQSPATPANVRAQLAGAAVRSTVIAGATVAKTGAVTTAAVVSGFLSGLFKG